MSNKAVIIVGAIVVVVVVLTTIVLPLSGYYAHRSHAGAAGGAKGQASGASSAQATPPASDGTYTLEQIAEMCVDEDLLYTAFYDSGQRFPDCMAARVATLSCPEAMKWALCEWAKDGPWLRSKLGDAELARNVNENLSLNIRTTVDTVSQDLAEKPAEGVSGSGIILLQGAGEARKLADALEAQLWKGLDAEADEFIARQAKLLAPLLADAKFQKTRADLIRAEVQSLQKDTKTCKELAEALKVSPQLVELRAKLCESLAAASAQAK
jgi:hypothetical protein